MLADIIPGQIMTATKPEPDFRQRKMRACLGASCLGKTKFLSDHPGHRLCPRCASQVQSISGGAAAA